MKALIARKSKSMLGFGSECIGLGMAGSLCIETRGREYQQFAGIGTAWFATSLCLLCDCVAIGNGRGGETGRPSVGQ